MCVQTVSAPDNTVTPEEIVAVEKVLAELNKDHLPKLAVISQFLLGFKMFRDVDNRLPLNFERQGVYFNLVSGFVFVSSCAEELTAGIEDADLQKIGASKAMIASISRYCREKYQLWFGVRDDEAASAFIADLATLPVVEAL